MARSLYPGLVAGRSMQRGLAHQARKAAKRLVLSGSASLLERARPAQPPAVWRALVAARSAAGNGPVVTRPSCERAVVIAPHPDDETIGCGGCVALLADMGTKVDVIAASAGEAGFARAFGPSSARGRAREGELRDACAILGATLHEVLRFPDGELADCVDDLARQLDKALSSLAPELIFVPWPLDDHPDHRAVARASALCTRLEEATEIWCYEVWSALPPNRLVDITPWSQRKGHALRAHKSAHVSFDPAAHLAINRWRSISGLGGTGEAEAYLVLRPAAFRRLVQGTQEQ